MIVRVKPFISSLFILKVVSIVASLTSSTTNPSIYTSGQIDVPSDKNSDRETDPSKVGRLNDKGNAKQFHFVHVLRVSLRDEAHPAVVILKDILPIVQYRGSCNASKEKSRPEKSTMRYPTRTKSPSISPPCYIDLPQRWGGFLCHR